MNTEFHYIHVICATRQTHVYNDQFPVSRISAHVHHAQEATGDWFKHLHKQ